ncbi:MAG: hypothetical protein ABW170_23725 [Candidatus Thiodiazotropha sp. L084R]
METLTVVAIFTAIQIAVIMIADKYFKFGFFANIALIVLTFWVVLIIDSVVIYFLAPFKDQAKNE